MIEELIAKVFSTRNTAHLAHWSTGSYAQHKALGDFYDDVIEAVDTLVEAYQAYKKVGAVDVAGSSYPILKQLEDDCKWMSENREEITCNMPALDNLLQGLEAVYLSTIYKLKRLS